VTDHSDEEALGVIALFFLLVCLFALGVAFAIYIIVTALAQALPAV
jgi:hypothetical protein